MNKEKILAMRAGRELDALVAGKVMGHPAPYSTDISAALLVVAKVTGERHCHCKIDIHPDCLASVEFTKATGLFTPDEILGWAGIDEDATVPEAICKAALLTKAG